MKKKKKMVWCILITKYCGEHKIPINEWVRQGEFLTAFKTKKQAKEYIKDYLVPRETKYHDVEVEYIVTRKEFKP